MSIDLKNKKLLKEWEKIKDSDIFASFEDFAEFYYTNGEKPCFRINTNEPWSNLALICFRFFRTKSMRSIVWNQERRETEKYKLSLDAICGRAAIPYNSLCELMPYQALRSWINKKTNRSSSFYFGGACLTKVEPNQI